MEEVQKKKKMMGQRERCEACNIWIACVVEAELDIILNIIYGTPNSTKIDSLS